MAENRDPDQIRREIEMTRRDLSNNVNALGQTVDPSNVVERQKREMRERVRSVKENIMGSASDASSTAGSAVDQAKQTAGDMPNQIKRQTRGNPLAAGMIALGAGWLVGSLFPASRAERQAATTVQEKAQPLVEDVKAQAQEVGQKLKDPAQDAVQQVKSEAQDAVSNVKQEGQSAADNVKESAADSKDAVQDHAQQLRS
ncbi:DUF3618 domain-containing protein [Cumulibacter manganitolerans]|uniref:DUF3618 domain-containing protein n=1 Tax=Cumulibacter manganitolerans TaxID=1884992 RepID=UPI001294AFD2|nr:DUF3618 domain-containing protein [Cumulibacter manganitolerans]